MLPKQSKCPDSRLQRSKHIGTDKHTYIHAWSNKPSGLGVLPCQLEDAQIHWLKPMTGTEL